MLQTSVRSATNCLDERSKHPFVVQEERYSLGLRAIFTSAESCFTAASAIDVTLRLVIGHLSSAVPVLNIEAKSSKFRETHL